MWCEVDDRPHLGDAHRHGPGDGGEVGRHEDQEDRHQRVHGLLGAAQVHAREQEEDEDLDRELGPQQVRRQEAEDRIRAGGDGERDGQHVVDDQCRAREHAELRGQQLGGHQVSATGEQFDDLAVAGRDDEHRQRRAQRHEERQCRMVTQGAEGFLRTVAGGGQAVGPQAHPGEEGQERELVKDRMVERIARIAQHEVPQARPDRPARAQGPEAPGIPRSLWSRPSRFLSRRPTAPSAGGCRSVRRAAATDADLGQEEGGGSGHSFQLLAQVTHVDPQVMGLVVEAGAPDSRRRLAWVTMRPSALTRAASRRNSVSVRWTIAPL